MNFYDKVYEIVAKIPKGKVVSYGQLASWCGNWRASRAVGYAMFRPPSERKLPCHRVVYRDGSLAAPAVFGLGVQRRLLEKEGVGFIADGRVDMEKYAWTPDTAALKKITPQKDKPRHVKR